MTWPWLDNYCDEAYAIFDDANRFKKATSAVDWPKIKTFLGTVTSPD